MNAAVVYDSY